MKKMSTKEKRELKREMTSLGGGKISQLMIMTPLMKKKIEENRTIFGSEPILQKMEMVQLNMNHSEVKFLKVKSFTYKKEENGETLTKKIDKEYIWNKILKKYPKSDEDYETIAKEIAKEFLRAKEIFIDVKWDTYSKEINL